jgi:hypothetical protein
LRRTDSSIHRLVLTGGENRKRNLEQTRRREMTAPRNASREAAQIPEPATGAEAATDSPVLENRTRPQRAMSARTNRYASDDEILGIGSAASPTRSGSGLLAFDTDAGNAESEFEATANGVSETNADSVIAQESPGDPQTDLQIQAALDANPELRRAWKDAQSYRQAFATPEEARAATQLLLDLNRMDALFFSGRPEDHAELARSVAILDPSAFASLAEAMSNLVAKGQRATSHANGSGGLTQPAHVESQATPSQSVAPPQTQAPRDKPISGSGHTPAQVEFLHTANAAAVQGVLDAIETQVDRLLPEGVSRTARNRVIGEIYRELDANLESNHHLRQQLRDAFRSGNLDAHHQSAVVALITGRARQALPGIAKRVLNEWTSTMVAASQDRLARQRAAAHRVDIAGSGRSADGGRRSLGPRDVDYTRMSDSDILNL